MRTYVAPIPCGVREVGRARRTGKFLAACALIAVVLGGCSGMPARTGDLIDQALAGSHRAKGNSDRDIYRHPKETLLFFGLRPEMTVVEIWPGGGWYTEVLAPVVRERGILYAAHVYVDEKSPRNIIGARENFQNKLAAEPAVYDQVRITAFNASGQANIAPAGSVDLVLTFRNVHNWAAAKSDEAAFQAFYAALKPGGVLGVVEHRAAEGASLEQMIKSGYMTEAYVISLAAKAGFKLAGKSEVNANARDTKDYASGVWTLPPTYRLGEKDRAKYAAIGESDRMTFKFVKPAN